MLMRIEFNEKKLQEIMKELEEAERTIYNCYSKLQRLGVAVVMESGCDGKQPE